MSTIFLDHHGVPWKIVMGCPQSIRADLARLGPRRKLTGRGPLQIFAIGYGYSINSLSDRSCHGLRFYGNAAAISVVDPQKTVL